MTQSLPEVPAVTAPSEPLAGVAGVSALAVAAIALLVAFGVPVSDDQRLAIVGVIATGAPIVTVLWARRRVFSPRTVAQLVTKARAGRP